MRVVRNSVKVDDRIVEVATTKLRVIATTDIHGAVLPYDYVSDQPNDGTGLSALSQTIDQARAECDATLLVDNGDFMQGTAMTDAVALSQNWRASEPHPMTTALNALTYDAVALGNHEFNFGLDALAYVIADLACPVLCANILDTKSRVPFATPWTILDQIVTLDNGRQTTVKVGIIAFAPSQIPIWDRMSIKGQLIAQPIVKCAQQEVPKLQAAGADIVIALCHSGIGPHEDAPDIENAAIPLASVDGIDAMIIGHTHLKFPSDNVPGGDPDSTADGVVDYQNGTIHGKPVVMPMAHARSLGCIDLTLSINKGRWHIDAFEVSQRTMQGDSAHVVTDPFAVMPTMKRAHDATLKYIRTPIGALTCPVNSYFSHISNCRTLQIVNDAQVHTARQFLSGTRFADLPILSATAPFKAGGRAGATNFIDIPKGPVLMRHATDLYCFPNVICAAPFSGAEIMNWLERSAGVFNHIRAGGGSQSMIDDRFPSYNFDVLCGLNYTIDVSQPPRFDPLGGLVHAGSHRVRDVTWKGRAVAPDDQFMIVSNSYRIGGGGAFFRPDPSRPVINTGVQARDAIVDYMKYASPLTPEIPNDWHFAPIKGAIGLFPTALAAVNVVSTIRDRNVLGFDMTQTDANPGFVIGKMAFD